MSGDAYLARIDQHMARGNELMERGNRLMDRGNELMGRVEQEVRLNREFHSKVLADFRQFTRDITTRVERIGGEELRALNELLEGQRDAREETRAQREALLRAIDRLDRLDQGGSGSSA